MKPKYRYATKEEIPAALSGHYVEKDGAWVLDFEGVADADKLREFRDNNIALAKERDDIKKQWEGFSLDEVKALIAKKAEIEAQKSKDKGEIDKLIAERTDAMKAAHDKALAEAQKAAQDATAELAKLKIDAALIEAGVALGLRDTAHQDLINRGRAIFSLENGQIVATKDGKPVYGPNAEPLTITEWVNQTAKEAAHLFAPNSGGGAPGGKNTQIPGFSGKNPWKQESFNLTQQAQLMRSDPGLASRLAAEAGIKLPGAA